MNNIKIVTEEELPNNFSQNLIFFLQIYSENFFQNNQKMIYYLCFPLLTL